MTGEREQGERPHNCEAELKASPRYNLFNCAPTWFRCSCGREFEHVCDEAEGCSWEEVEVDV